MLYEKISWDELGHALSKGKATTPYMDRITHSMIKNAPDLLKRIIKLIFLIQSRNLFILVPPLPPKVMSVWRSNAGSLLPTGAIMVSMGN